MRRTFRLIVVAAALLSCGGGGAFLAPPPLGATGDPVIVAAGDIACDPTNSNFNGGNGSSNSCRQRYTADLINSIAPAGVLVLGDNQYYCGGYNAFLQSYDLSWGSYKPITHPSVGNHEYLTSGGTDCNAGNAGAHGYFTYFGAAAGQPGQGYYSYDVGTWHIIALNSNCGDAGGCSATSPQGQWLAADLAAHPATCTLAYWHIPLYSSGGRASSNSRPFWQLLYDNNADLILSAHDHTYERFAPQTPTGTVDNVRGIREFIVGTGGANHTSFVTTAANSEVRNATTFGVLKLTLHSNSYDWQFVPEAGQSFNDSGTTACHGATSDNEPPTAPSNLTGTAVNGGRVDLSWTASTDNVGVAGYRIFRNSVQIGTTTGTTYSDLTAIPSTSYSYYVVAYDASNNVSPPSNTVTVRTPADTTPPSTPTNLAGTAPGPTEVDLTWSPSTDDVGVAGYEIFRDGSQIGTSSSASYADHTTQASTTYTYTVRAYDVGGNRSGQSSPVTVTTPAAPTTLVFGPSADTFVEADTPTTNYGSDTAIGTDNSPVKRILLKFNVSGVQGRQVLSATLRLYCVNPSGLGGIFHRVADTSWSESGVTWNNAPPGDAATLGQLGAVATGNWYQVNVTQLVTGDGTFSLDATSTSSDGADYSSKEGTAGLAPQLVVTTSGSSSDTNPPSVPAGLTATATGASHVDLNWQPSTDDVGVAGYKIFRNSVQIGTSPTASFSDTTALPQTSYTYAVSAFDAAGNTSALSAPATVTTPADTTLTFTPVADAYVESDLPGSTFGAATTLRVDANPVQDSLLKFTVSGVGSRQVTSATLRLFCVDSSNIGGAFRRVLDTSWTENGVTWANAPTGEATAFGSLRSVSSGSWYGVTVPFVTGDGTYSVRVSSTASNGAFYSSKEGANPPQLIVNTG
jgi:acid phosphatase type 7